MTPSYDYRFKFRVADLDLALEAMVVLRLAGILTTEHPINMLGEPRGAQGQIVTEEEALFRGSRGTLAVTTPDGVIPAKGDTGWFYIHIVSTVSPDVALAELDPADFGLEATTAAESAEVLGEWWT